MALLGRWRSSRTVGRADRGPAVERAHGVTRRVLLAVAVVVPTARSRSAWAVGGPVIDQGDSDVWAFEAVVTGSGAARVEVDGRPVEVLHRDGRFAARVVLRAGVNRLVAVARDGARSMAVVFTSRVRDVPTARITVRGEGHGVRLSAAASTASAGSRAALTSYRWSRPDGTTAGTGRELAVAPGGLAGPQLLGLTVGDAAGRTDRATAVVEVSAGRARPVDLGSWHPAWVDDAVVYGVVPPLFGRDGLRAVTRRLADLADLGVSVLWLAPLFATVPGDFGYAVTDHFRVRPDYGTAADLRELVVSAHARGMRVLLDLVVNHTSSRHPYFRQAQREGRPGHCWPFYDRDARGRPTHYFDWADLPNLGYDDPEVRRLVLEVSTYWVREFGVDGYRVDAAWGVHQRRPGFWPQWRAELQRVCPDVLLLAEATARQQWADGHGFDLAYDWTDQLGEWAWADVFTGAAPVAPRLRDALSRPCATTPLRFLDNNDTGERFLSRHGPGLTRAATAVLLTLPGVPLLYTGSEVGAEYQPYQRQVPLDLDADPHGLRAFHRELVRLRRSTPALYGPGFALLDADPADAVLAYRRTARDGAAVDVLVNTSGSAVQARLPGRSVPLGPWEHRVLSGPVRRR